jgi:hypothetical protein
MVLTMMILALFGYLLIAMILMAMLARTRPYRRMEVPGRILAAYPLTLWQKILFHRSSLMALGFAVFFGSVFQWLPNPFGWMIAAFAGVILLMPMQYRLTTDGVAFGEAAFRPWSEFTGVAADTKGLRLDHPSRFGRLTLPVPPARMDNVITQVRRHLSTTSHSHQGGTHV